MSHNYWVEMPMPELLWSITKFKKHISCCIGKRSTERQTDRLTNVWDEDSSVNRSNPGVDNGVIRTKTSVFLTSHALSGHRYEHKDFLFDRSIVINIMTIASIPCMNLFCMLICAKRTLFISCENSIQYTGRHQSYILVCMMDYFWLII